MSDNIQMKRCSHCGVSKTLDAFHSGSNGGFHCYCKVCDNAIRKKNLKKRKAALAQEQQIALLKTHPNVAAGFSRICRLCKQEKPLTDEFFTRHGGPRDKLSSLCVSCFRQQRRAWGAAHRDQLHAASAKHRAKYRARCRERARRYYEQHKKEAAYRETRGALYEKYRLNPELQQRNRFRLLKKKYGLSQTDYDALLFSQNGKCAICGVLAACAPKKILAVDHDHTTRLIRGLLCDKCNSLLGFAGDHIEILQAAIKYLANVKNRDGAVT